MVAFPDWGLRRRENGEVVLESWPDSLRNEVEAMEGFIRWLEDDELADCYPTQAALDRLCKEHGYLRETTFGLPAFTTSEIVKI
jgi:hypothetical protein